MNVIILGTKRKLLPVYNYCRDKNYNISVIGNPKANHENDTDILTSIATHDIEIIPDIIINMKEHSSYLIKETRLNRDLYYEKESHDYNGVEQGNRQIFG